MARKTQRHHEEPALEHLTGIHIGDHRAGAEIHLRGICRGELEPERHFDATFGGQLAQQPIACRVTAGIAVLTHQCRMHGGALDAGRLPLPDLFAPGCQAHRTLSGRRGQYGGELGIRRQRRRLGRKPALCGGQGTHASELAPPHESGPGNLSVRIPLAQTHQDLSVLIHLKRPLAHGGSRQKPAAYRFRKRSSVGPPVWLAPLVKIHWRHYLKIYWLH